MESNSPQSRVAVIFPGGQFGPHSALLKFAADAAEMRGATIVSHSWTRPFDSKKVDSADRPAWVAADADPVLDVVATGFPGVLPVLIGKSLGSCAAIQAAERCLPAIWITPLLTTLPPVVQAIRKATAPVLLIGGTADRTWDGDLARELSPYVLEITDADHGLYVPGRLAASADVLGRVATVVEEFLDQAIWPD